jgi:transketolase
MAGLAAGLASEGLKVFIYSIANFPTFRCAEQIRNDIAYHNLGVTVVSVGAGLSYGALGYSHHAVQDYSLMRTMPNMTIAAPGDPMEVRSALRAIVSSGRPSYLRLGKAGEKPFHTTAPQISDGVWLPLHHQASNKKAILTTGTSLQVVAEWFDADAMPNTDFFSVPMWSMDNKLLHCENLRRYNSVITIEDHLVDGGFGSYVGEIIHTSDLTLNLNIIAFDPMVCGEVASEDTLRALGGVTKESLRQSIKDVG